MNETIAFESNAIVVPHLPLAHNCTQYIPKCVTSWMRVDVLSVNFISWWQQMGVSSPKKATAPG